MKRAESAGFILVESLYLVASEPNNWVSQEYQNQHLKYHWKVKA